MRFFIVTLFFFFAPVILMFAMRHLTLLLRIWLAYRRARKTGDRVIDITPEIPRPASRKFIAFAVLLGVICASLVWMRLGEPVSQHGVYVPAQIDSQGHIVPGHFAKP